MYKYPVSLSLSLSRELISVLAQKIEVERRYENE